MKKARFRVLFSGGDEEDRPTCCRDGRHAPGHRNSPPDCFYCFAIALFDPLLNKKTETICLRNDFCFSGGDEEDRPTCCRDGRHAPGHRNSPPDCFYCFAIALFDPLLNKKTETICLRNDFCFSGGDEEDRTLDLTDANRTLSQLSYAPTFAVSLTANDIIP